jgi:hypothetical protein
MKKSRDRSVGIATGYKLGGSGSIPGRARIFSVFHIVETGAGAHQATYPIGTVISLTEDKAAGA